MSWKPTFKLYASDGVTLAYTFPLVINSNYAEVDNDKFIKVANGRSKGAIYIAGGKDSEPLFVQGVLHTSNYQALVVLMNALKTAIAFNTNYYLRIDKANVTGPSGYDEYKVKRMVRFNLPVSAGGSDTGNKRVRRQDYTVTFENNAW